jgi:hypothetical protein
MQLNWPLASDQRIARHQSQIFVSIMTIHGVTSIASENHTSMNGWPSALV